MQIDILEKSSNHKDSFGQVDKMISLSDDFLRVVVSTRRQQSSSSKSKNRHQQQQQNIT